MLDQMIIIDHSSGKSQKLELGWKNSSSGVSFGSFVWVFLPSSFISPFSM